MISKEIDIEPLKMDLTQYGCTEHGIFSVLKHYSLNYCKSYWNSLNLIYDFDALNHCGKTAFRFVSRSKSIIDLCYETYGVKFVCTQNNHLKDYIWKNILEDRILLAYVDVFWDENAEEYYQKVHDAGHSRIISGFNENMLIYYEWDRKYKKSFEIFEKSVDNICYMENTRMQQKQYIELLGMALINLKESVYIEINTKMLIELQRVLKKQDVKKYLLGFAKVGNSPFFNSIRILARSRKCMKIFLYFLLSQNNNLPYNDLSWIKKLYYVLEELEIEWNILINLLLKLYVLAEKNEEKDFGYTFGNVMEAIIKKEEIVFDIIQSYSINIG